MMTESQKKFIQLHGKTLREIFSDKLSEMLKEVLDTTVDRDKKIDAINVLREWLMEIKMIEGGQEIKKTTFI